MVQNGKFALCAFAFDKQLKRVDLPTLGSPTMPHCKAILVVRFVKGKGSAASGFLPSLKIFHSFSQQPHAPSPSGNFVA